MFFVSPTFGTGDFFFFFSGFDFQKKVNAYSTDFQEWLNMHCAFTYLPSKMKNSPNLFYSIIVGLSLFFDWFRFFDGFFGFVFVLFAVVIVCLFVFPQ